MKNSLCRVESHFMDWLICRNRFLQWLFIFFGIPALLFLVLGLFASVLTVPCLLLGIL